MVDNIDRQDSSNQKYSYDKVPLDTFAALNSRLTWSWMLCGTINPNSNSKVAFENFPYLISTYTGVSDYLNSQLKGDGR